MTTDIFARIAHSRTSDDVVHQIEVLVLEGILRVGDRLPGERELAKQFDVSRPILREALKVLEGRGLLLTQHGGGTFVADVIGQVFTRPVMELITRHQKATLDYLEYRREMEGISAEFAARRATKADKALLTRIVTAMKAAHQKDDFEEEAAIDVEFHSAIGECAHNIILLHTLRSCYRLLAEGVFYNRALVYNLPGAREQLLAQHLAIYEAVMAGDPEAGRRAAQAHIDFVARAMTDAERSGDWERVSKLRLQQRAPDLSGTDKTTKQKQSEAAQ
ncbi:transcriptional regulator [Hoeflea sp. IMCC20628]|uniref:FCD domain-containing protein n=1 Tax=Hoeflea sp. IMCC20628 TaxID=1620421 RepID=UPI00063ADB85|nr:FCD domain-containing protein [Hoeflea sp. IMCC20628]AKI01743.1 transcriptional regulator [Hoeflea sp. IMCC20628]